MNMSGAAGQPWTSLGRLGGEGGVEGARLSTEEKGDRDT